MIDRIFQQETIVGGVNNTFDISWTMFGNRIFSETSNLWAIFRRSIKPSNVILYEKNHSDSNIFNLKLHAKEFKNRFNRFFYFWGKVFRLFVRFPILTDLGRTEQTDRALIYSTMSICRNNMNGHSDLLVVGKPTLSNPLWSDGWQCDQIKSPNVYKSCPKWIH